MVLTHFRLEGTLDLLWTARMSVLPQDGAVCTRIVDDVETAYKVERVGFEFRHANDAEITGYVEGVPQYGPFVPSAITSTRSTVIVSVVP